jgi:hypothetical protein
LLFSDPRQWTAEHCLIWLNWAKREFSLEINNFEAFMKMNGRDIVGLGREGFLAIAPPFTGDILWEHLEILQKGELEFKLTVKNKQTFTFYSINSNSFQFTEN